MNLESFTIAMLNGLSYGLLLFMGHGSIVFDGTPDSLRADAYIRKEWLEV